MKDVLSAMNREIKTPYYLCDSSLLKRNLLIMNQIEQRAGCTVLFSMKSFNAIGVLSEIFDGRVSGYSTGSSFEFRSVDELRLKHSPLLSIYKPAFTEAEILEYSTKADFLVFNSVGQLKALQWVKERHDIEPRAKIGVRVNPEISIVEKDLYNPCRTNSHLGIKITELGALEGRYSGILIHNMCQSRDANEFSTNLDLIEQKLDTVLTAGNLTWINFGGGSLFTAPGYDLDRVIDRLKAFRAKYGLEVYLEPSEAWVLDAGYLVAGVLDITGSENKSAILDISVPAHIPDVLEIPYTPRVVNGRVAAVSKVSYTLCGLSCMSGDVVGTYEFDTGLRIGSKIAFEDMLPYSMVKSSFFNGVAKPDIYLWCSGSEIKNIKTYAFEDYVNA
ncbi:diaminopimelate decarboxylase [Ectopseudomonas chengduensis]|nr:diaminopimelate decarboxylase [Pseudomonas chengduensis]MDH1281561.1 diaminopimelate decarboxylase [Pseudomonas chengduensis]